MTAHLPEPSAGRLPDFLIVGAPKAGTTTLFQYLMRHPDVFLSTPKEPNFFSHDEPWSRGEAWYRSLFADARPDQLAGEASTASSWFPHGPDVPERIHRIVGPDVKLIYLMRHPVERAFSHYGMERHKLTETFEERLAGSDFYVDLGIYIRQIEHYLRFFPRESMHLVLFDDLLADPSAVVDGVQRFLGLRPLDLLGVAAPIRANDTAHKAKQRTVERLRAVPVVGFVADRVPKSARTGAYRLLTRTPLGRRIEAPHRAPPLRPETRAMLLERFDGPTRELEAFLGRDLSAWRA